MLYRCSEREEICRIEKNKNGVGAVDCANGSKLLRTGFDIMNISFFVRRWRADTVKVKISVESV